MFARLYGSVIGCVLYSSSLCYHKEDEAVEHEYMCKKKTNMVSVLKVRFVQQLLGI